MPRYSRHVTLKDLSSQLNLSMSAVAQALNDRPGTVKVSEKTRQKVQALAQKLGYRHSMAARALTTGKTGMFGILSTWNLMHSNAVYIGHAAREFKARGVTPLVMQGESSTKEGWDHCVEMLLDAGVDGVLILRPEGRFSDSHIERLRNYGLQAVSIGLFSLPQVPQFMPQRKAAFQKVTKHLVEAGYQSIMLLARPYKPNFPSYDLTSRSYEDGFRAAIEEAKQAGHRVKFDIHTYSSESDSPPEGTSTDVHALHAPGYFAMRELIAQKKIPDALVCPSDAWALGVLKACTEAGIRVPEDMALTGYGDDPSSSAGAVSLTTLKEPFEALCNEAISQLMKTVKTGEKAPLMCVEMPCDLIVRQSSNRFPPPVPLLKTPVHVP